MSGSTVFTKDAVDPLIHKQYLNELADAYLPAGIDRKDPRVSPLYANLKGFPPILIQVGSAETLLDDANRFAAVAGAADARGTLPPLTCECWGIYPRESLRRQRGSDPCSYNKPRLRKSPRLPPEERLTNLFLSF